MVVDDYTNSYSKGWYGNGDGNIWNYGVEAWCNMEGQYVTIEADLTELSG